MSPLKRKLAFLLVVAAVAASGAGAYAATQTSSASPRQTFLNDVAHRLHVSPQTLRKALVGALEDRLSALVASGRLTKLQAATIEQRLKRSGGLRAFGLIGALVGPDRPWMRRGWFAYAYPPAGPWRMPPGGPGAMLPPGVQAPPPPWGYPPAAMPAPFPGPGPRLLPPPLIAGPGFWFLVPGGLKATVSYLGIRPGRLLAGLRAGRSLAQIARAQGKTASGLESAIHTALKARLDRQVARGHLTESQAARILRALDARTAAIVNLRMEPLRAGMRPWRIPGMGRFGLRPHRNGLRSHRAGLHSPFSSG